jgi:hypothetical protein
MSYKEIKNSNGSFLRVWRNGAGNLHRELAPAIIYYNSDGSIETECFYLNGVQHRESGPAIISYHPDGSIEREFFYLNEKFLGKDDIGFWVLWDRLTDDKRNNLEILKCLVRFS